jgi:DNA-binding NarL/FixJ family response regulator
MRKIYNLVIVDDHIMFRDALKFVLAQSDSLKVIAEASTGTEFLEILEKCKPDLVLMDISIPAPDGVESTKEALKKYPDLKIIALSMFSDELYYCKMIEAGARGYIQKEAGGDELLKTVFTVLNGEKCFSNEILCNIIRNIYRDTNVLEVTRKKNIKLSKRENEVLELICAGYSNVEVASKLGIGRRTIEGHRSSLLKKTGAKNSVNLVLYAKQHMISNE